MDEGEINRQLRELVEQLKYENELLRAKVIELEARLAQYENAHTPPSLLISPSSIFPIKEYFDYIT